MAMTTTPLRRNPPRRAREVPVQLTANLADSASELDHEWVSPKAIKSARPTRPRKAGAVRIVGDGQPLTRKLCRSRPASSDDGFPLGDGAVRTIEPSLGQCRLPINMHQFTDAAELRGVHAALLGWYVTHQRAMPWRIPYRPDHDSEPAAVDLDQRGYEVWVSEIMLQQTQVATVREYYRRWMIEFPTVQALAAAPLDRVYQLWAGLGYYSRAKRLHEGATFLVKENSGSLPRDAATLMKAVPGVGRYTAGAVASIAFGRPEPLVDGNVVRVLTRLRAWGGDVTKASGVRWTWDTAAELLHQSAPGHWNQALMELGATVCTPTKPKCETCPLVEFCHAYTQLHDKPRYWELAGKRRRDVPDIEDCGLCTFPAGPQLWPNMSHYPQKPAKKVARQEGKCERLMDLLWMKSYRA
ncbi:hypothetical protein IWQ60_002666 [Tieghemiomyces parasiticus]|uniref:Adenine DNA glycosylase n=1 Tax=Tieghemiomyces parasiticus TaxID=78921 RepID=A0A9W8AC94_9FUNG|nr:hypothetical protein IWQ60_002666 [Tieghemiomyces parasiticus]